MYTRGHFYLIKPTETVTPLKQKSVSFGFPIRGFQIIESHQKQRKIKIEKHRKIKATIYIVQNSNDKIFHLGLHTILHSFS